MRNVTGFDVCKTYKMPAVVFSHDSHTSFSSWSLPLLLGPLILIGFGLFITSRRILHLEQIISDTSVTPLPIPIEKINPVISFTYPVRQIENPSSSYAFPAPPPYTATQMVDKESQSLCREGKLQLQGPASYNFPLFPSHSQAGLYPANHRKSYTTTTPEGMEVNGEIVTGEGWRRHTKVYGGGVCEACLENDRRMSA